MIPLTAVTQDNFLLWLGSFGGFAILILVFSVVRIKGDSIAGRVGALLDARAARIDAQLKMAQENTEAARKAHEEGEDEIARARVEAGQIVERAQSLTGSLRDELAAAAEQDKNRIVGQAIEEIQTERNRAIMELRSRAADVAVDAARVVLLRTLDERTDRDIIAKALVDDSPNGESGRS